LSCAFHHLCTFKKLSDCDVFKKSFASPCFNQQLPGQVGDLTRFKGHKLYCLIERISRHRRPVREMLQHHSLPHRQRPEVSFEAKAFDRWNFNLKHMQRRARLRFFKNHVCSAPYQHVVYRLQTVLRSLDFCKEDRLHDSRRGS
jgi:hypothetical protein